MTIIDFKNIIGNFFENYLLKCQLFFGDISDIVGLKDIAYPAVFVDYTGTEINFNASNYSFDFYITDLIDKHSKENYLDVVSQCEKIASDLISYLYPLTGSTFNISVNTTIQPIRDTYNDDEISGVKLTIIFTTINQIDKCAIPLSSAPSVLLQESGAPILLEN